MVRAARAALGGPRGPGRWNGLVAKLTVIGAIVAATSACDDDFVHGEAADFAATIAVTNDVGVLGSIAFDVRYVGASGEFVVDDDGVSCEIVAPDAFAVVTPRSSERVSVGISSFTGIASPGSLVRCRIRCVTPLEPGDIAIALTEALDMAGDPTLVAPALEVAAISDVGTTTTTRPDGSGSTTTLILP